MLRDEADLPLLQLGTQALRIEHLQLGHHHLDQQDFKALPDRVLLVLTIGVPVHHFVMKALAAPADEIAVDRGAEPDTGCFDTL
ncbi:hypothetical protein D3C80_1978350 [compost metagenome]